MSREVQPGWYSVGTVGDIPPLGARVVRLGNRAVALFRTSTDEVFALLDRCPHRGGPLSQGIVHGNCVTCPLHDWVIRLDTGEARAPDEGRTERFPVRIVNGRILLGVPDALEAAGGADTPRAGPLAVAQ